MKTIEVKDQPVLSLRRTVQITANGIRYRLFRSLVTVGVVAVAVAFLMNIVSESLIRRAIVKWSSHRIAELRLAASWVGRLASHDSPALRDALRGRPLMEALAEADGAFGDAIRAAGFALDPQTGRRVAEQARRNLHARAVERSVATPQMRQAVAAYLDLMPADVSIGTLWHLLRRPRAAAWYLAKQKETGGDAAGLTAERLVELARAEAEESALAHAERMTVATGGITGGGQRMDWLVIASLLVCVVGISNSMLMSVTERFREIATLKCLGALDGFIMLMFVLEAAFLGVVGGALGAVLGAALGFARMLAAFGSLATASFPVAQVAMAIAASLVLGIVLAAVASIYPSLKAARLAPMEAMRIQ